MLKAIALTLCVMMAGASELDSSPVFESGPWDGTTHWSLDGSFELQQSVTCSRSGVASAIELHLTEGVYAIRCAVGEPWQWGESVVSNVAVVRSVGWHTIEVPSVSVGQGEVLTVRVSGVGAVGVSAYYNHDDDYGETDDGCDGDPHDWYEDGQLWGFGDSWYAPGVLGCLSQNKTFDLAFVIR